MTLKREPISEEQADLLSDAIPAKLSVEGS